MRPWSWRRRRTSRGVSGPKARGPWLTLVEKWLSKRKWGERHGSLYILEYPGTTRLEGLASNTTV